MYMLYITWLIIYVHIYCVVNLEFENVCLKYLQKIQ